MPDVNPWLPLPPGSPDAHPVYCLPYAGGSAAIYRPWRRQAPPGIAVVPVQPPGRRERFEEPPLTSAVAMAEQAGAAILPTLRGPYSLFGISMGALVAFELAHWLSERGRPPVRLFVASYPAPHVPRTLPRVHDSPDSTVVELLSALRVTPPEILASEEMRNLLMPLIRADLAVTETYVPRVREPLRMPVTVLRGVDDPHLSEDSARAWSALTEAACTVERFDAGHFLVHERPAEVMRLLAAPAAG
nr:alpha/beta fold hydrolase [Dactylosporangium thailandense]